MAARCGVGNRLQVVTDSLPGGPGCCSAKAGDQPNHAKTCRNFAFHVGWKVSTPNLSRLSDISQLTIVVYHVESLGRANFGNKLQHLVVMQTQ